MVKNLFVLDADIFIAAHRSYYAFDIAPGFWDALLKLAKTGKIISISQVEDDLKKGHDPENQKEYDILAKWAIADFHPYFMKTDATQVIDAYTKIINWVFDSKVYPVSAKDEFASVSDSWLLAYSLANNAVLVTNENKLNVKVKVPIPIVCKHFGIEYKNTFDLLRTLQVKLS
ncbi:MAG: DUF4411 family protein [Candidatus Cloacimonetes bacterium]|jgi:hypothetical protein|nr:DUF4411 family protein [Candidatus Cloacimonadota bacterium]MDY0173512.1 DUF4411 family protein [Candidatus Cloacimonadaceae bacterium]